ncbi:MAG TPA: hypothetical protein DDW56_19790 [Cyanobacteria bacterium UBA11366]|nr:hypothetical protein [Cyanobacteria bacterium UBA11366]HBK63143.1 hypothetical protein [Cyanobacteria bacterium UBA11166]
MTHNSVEDWDKVISPPLDYPSIIAGMTQVRKLLKININKFNEVKGLSAVFDLLNYIKHFLLAFLTLLVLIC